MKFSLPMIAALDKADLKKINERDFSIAVREYAEAQGWKVEYRFRSAVKLANGTYRGSGPAGFPDLFMCREADRRVMALELKTQVGRPSEAQLDWIHVLSVCKVEADIVKPEDAADIIRRLT